MKQTISYFSGRHWQSEIIDFLNLTVGMYHEMFLQHVAQGVEILESEICSEPFFVTTWLMLMQNLLGIGLKTQLNISILSKLTIIWDDGLNAEPQEGLGFGSKSV